MYDCIQKGTITTLTNDITLRRQQIWRQLPF